MKFHPKGSHVEGLSPADGTIKKGCEHGNPINKLITGKFVAEGSRTWLEEIDPRTCLSKCVLSPDPSPSLSSSAVRPAASSVTVTAMTLPVHGLTAMGRVEKDLIIPLNSFLKYFVRVAKG